MSRGPASDLLQVHSAPPVEVPGLLRHHPEDPAGIPSSQGGRQAFSQRGDSLQDDTDFSAAAQDSAPPALPDEQLSGSALPPSSWAPGLPPPPQEGISQASDSIQVAARLRPQCSPWQFCLFEAGLRSVIDTVDDEVRCLALCC